MAELPKTLSADQVCSLLGINRSTLWRRMKAGMIRDRRPPGARKMVFLLTDIFPDVQSQEAAA